MDRKEIFCRVDHTLLYPVTTWEQIRVLCDQAIAFGAASVCIPSCYVKQAHEYVAGRMTICTVVGFPNGNTTPACKAFEAKEAIENGAKEIDMVINLGMLKAGNTQYVLDEIRLLKKTVGDLVLKVIIETCDLTEEEKITMCDIVTESADILSGVLPEGRVIVVSDATIDRLYHPLLAPYDTVLIGAGESIKTLQTVESIYRRFIELGADRLGTSRIIKLALQEKVEEGTY